MAYRWLRDGVAIGGAESSVYTVTATDEGHSIACEVTATNAIGSKSVVSAGSVAILDEAREIREAEAASTAKKQQEEAKTAAAVNVALVGSVISVRSDGKGSVRLTCTGTATCTGRLTLTVKRKAKKRQKAKAETIGTAAFSITSGKTGVVTITLTVAGRGR